MPDPLDTREFEARLGRGALASWKNLRGVGTSDRGQPPASGRWLPFQLHDCAPATELAAQFPIRIGKRIRKKG
jgi:hypothetical protein